MVFFESPRRLAATLAAAASAFGADRRAAVCRELTKTYEEIRRGTLAELAEWAADVRGEITLVIAGASPAADDTDLAGAVAEREGAGLARKEAIAEVARVRGVPKRAVFDAVVAAKPPGHRQ
jgi:16S rRNA (cytidine1402-2'-O)-methyltransferase